MSSRWQRFNKLVGEFYHAPYRRTLARAQRDQDDPFLMMVTADALGIPNPASGATLEILPEILNRVHDWHRRQGLESSPFEGLSCC